MAPSALRTSQWRLLLPLLFSLLLSVSPAQPAISIMEEFTCVGRRVYTLPLPARFNQELLYRGSHDQNMPAEWFTQDLLVHLEKSSHNNGFGRPIPSILGVSEMEGAWYQTDQNALEVIFYARMLTYPCRVESYQEADLIYVPYFGGHDSLRHMHKDKLTRDRLGHELAGIIKNHPAWQQRNGSDHFLVLGRNLWDFWRGQWSEWGSDLLLQDGLKEHIWAIVVESVPGITNVVSVPKPTGFHPTSRFQLERWQNFVKESERPWLFSFAGGHREMRTEEGVLREKLFWQCKGTENCVALDCSEVGCHDINHFFSIYMSSVFCLHPIGDACTRRSVLDAALAGCIPVVFRKCTLEEQFEWHLGAHKSSLYVYIPLEDVKGTEGIDFSHWPTLENGQVMIEDVLKAIPADKVAEMRERVVGIIPSITYGGTLEGETLRAPDFKDGIDTMLDGLAKHAVLR